MKILVDTNILISAILYPRSKPAEAFVYIAENHEMVLCSQNLAELREVLNEKAPQALPDAELLLKELPYELIPVDSHTQRLIRDPKDQPILNAAMHYGVDIILTGDKDFLSLDLKRLRCMSAAQFLEIRGVLVRLLLLWIFLSDY